MMSINRVAKTILGIPILVLLTGLTSVHAQQAGRIAVFDFQKTVEGSLEGRKAISQLQVKEQEIRTELSNIEKQILSFETKLNTQRLTLSLEAKQNLLFDIENLKVEQKRVEEDSAKEYQQLQFRLQNKIKREVLAVVESIAIDKEFSLVLDVNTGGIAYFSRHFDITEDVIRQYDSSISKK